MWPKRSLLLQRVWSSKRRQLDHPLVAGFCPKPSCAFYSNTSGIEPPAPEYVEKEQKKSSTAEQTKPSPARANLTTVLARMRVEGKGSPNQSATKTSVPQDFPQPPLHPEVQADRHKTYSPSRTRGEIEAKEKTPEESR